MRKIDSHSHIVFNNPQLLLEQSKEDYGYEKLGVMGIPSSHGILNNLECLRVKALAPDYAYVYGGMAYREGIADNAETHEKQLQLLMDAGFDGWKILESKPARYAKLQKPLDSALFSRAFAMAEKEQIPITWHSGDPATFWSAETAPAFAVKNHWLCVGEGMPTLAECYRQTETVLDRYPKLCVTLAHLFFTSDDIDHAVRLMEQHPNLFLDVTPGNEMYDNFMKKPEEWTNFFVKYQDRLIYGTDMVDNRVDSVFGSQKAIVELTIKTLFEKTPFTVWEITGTGLGLPETVLQKLMAENFEKYIQPNAPKAISKSGVNAYAEFLAPILNKDETRQMEDLLNELA